MSNHKKTGIKTGALLVLAAWLAGCSPAGPAESRIPVGTGGRVPITTAAPATSESGDAQSTEGPADTPATGRRTQAEPTTTAASIAAPSTTSVSSAAVVKTVAVNTALANTDSGPQLTSPAFQSSLYGAGQVRVTLTNSTALGSVRVYFNTAEDSRFNLAKSKPLSIAPSTTAARAYTVDFSDCYGWTGTLDRIRIESGLIDAGAIQIQKLELLAGGGMAYPFRIGEKKVVKSRAQIKATTGGQNWFPDGIMGVTKNADGTLQFLSSSPVVSGMHSVIAYKGTLDNPVQTLLKKDGVIEGVPEGLRAGEFNYASIGQVYPFGNGEMLTIVHLERHYTADGVRKVNGGYYLSSLALGYSSDNGMTWSYCGEIATPACEKDDPDYGMGAKMPSSVSAVPYSRDAGNGPFIVKDNYLYVYFIDCNENYSTGLGVIRAPLEAVIREARAKKTGRSSLWKKYYNGGWGEPALAGRFTSVIDNACPANFSTIHYNTHLKQYVLVRCSSPHFNTNDGDIVMNISGDPLNFKGRNYYIDAGTRGQQYPTLVGKGDDPGMTSDRSFYIYYIDYKTNTSEFLWDHADFVRREIVLD